MCPGERAGRPVRDVADVRHVIHRTFKLTADHVALLGYNLPFALELRPEGDEGRITGHRVPGLHLHPDDLSTA